MKIKLFFFLLIFFKSFISFSQPVDELISRSSSKELRIKKNIIKINNSIGTLNPFNTSLPFVYPESIFLSITLAPEISASETFYFPKSIFSVSYERNLSDALSIEFELGFGNSVHEEGGYQYGNYMSSETFFSYKYGVRLKKYLPFITKKYYPYGFYISPFINLNSFGDNHTLYTGQTSNISIYKGRWKGNLNIIMIGLGTGFQHPIGDFVFGAEFNFSFLHIIKTPKLKKSDFRYYPVYSAIEDEYFDYNYNSAGFIIPTNFNFSVGYNF